MGLMQGGRPRPCWVAGPLLLLVGTVVLLSESAIAARVKAAGINKEHGVVTIHIRSSTTEAEAKLRNVENIRAFKAMDDLWAKPASMPNLPNSAMATTSLRVREESLLRTVQERGRRPNQMSAKELRALRSLGVKLGQPFGSQGFFELEVPPGRDPEELLARLKEAGFAANFAPPPPVVNASPNDPSWDAGSVASQMRYPQAWDSLIGGRSVKVCVIDTGIDRNHPDLRDNVVATFNGVTNTSDVSDGDTTHGTHCAGSIGASGNNGQGISGVAWRVSILACKGLPGPWSAIANCIKWCREQGARITSNSYGSGTLMTRDVFGSSSNDALVEEIRESRNAGHLYIAAAANNGTLMTRTNWTYPGCLHAAFPADLNNMIVVGSVDSSFNRAASSNHGSWCVHMFARGVNVHSTAPGGRYTALSGTSMATPQVAGAAALLWLAQPTASYLEVKEALLNGGDVHPGAATSSSGRVLNAEKALHTAPISLPRPTFPTGTVQTVTINPMANTSLCLELPDGGNGVGLRQSSCRLGNMNQVFDITWHGAGGCAYTIRNKGRCLDVSNSSHVAGASIWGWNCVSPASNEDNQCFNFFPATGDAWQIRPRHSSLCMDVQHASTSAGGSLWQYTCWRDGAPGSVAQRFRRMHIYDRDGLSNGRHALIQTETSGRTKCWDVKDGGLSVDNKNPFPIQQTTCNQTRLSQQFQFQKVGLSGNGDYWYRIVIRHSGQSVGIQGDSILNGGRLIQWRPLHRDLEQEFYAVRRWGAPIEGPYHFINRNSNKCIDVPSDTNADRIDLQQWDCNLSRAQQFFLRFV